VALSGSRGTLDCSRPGESCSLLQAALAAKKTPKEREERGRDHICNGLGSEDITAKS